MTRGERPTILRQLLAEVATRVAVRVLIVAGAPVPGLRPWRGDLRKVRALLTAGTRIQCALDARERPMHCPREKTIVFFFFIRFGRPIDLTLFPGERLYT